MSQKRIDSTVDIKKPEYLKELHQFVGVANYFRDHIQQHSHIAKPLQEMITEAVRLKVKTIIWTPEAEHSFTELKRRINECPKLYYINESYLIVLRTDASDHTIGAYLYQETSEGGKNPYAS
jgi:hypothetical protein